jgi:hypothetical protein
MPLANASFAETQELAVRLSDLVRGASTQSNKSAETVKELTLLGAELDFAQSALQTIGTSLTPTLEQCTEYMVVRCFDTLSQFLTMAVATGVPVQSIYSSECGGKMLEWFRIQIFELRADLRRVVDLLTS